MAKVRPALPVVAVALLVALPALADGGTEAGDGLLVDFGNGRVEWHGISHGADIESTLTSSLPAGYVEFADIGGERRIASVDGQSAVTLGTGASRQTCEWRVYSWNTVEWEFLTMDVSGRHGGAPLAIGFYPNDTLKPASNPDYREVWISYRGDSASSGVSGSFGPASVATPLEWYNAYAGAVVSTVLYADGMIYHVTAGKYGSVGMDALARVNCLDPVNKTVLWTVTYSDSGNTEVTTPVIIGDLIVVTSGNWHIYCLDRFTGEAVAELAPVGEEGHMCGGSKLTMYIPRKDDPSVSSSRFHLEAGFTNAVYDSGALYFCTSDGLLRCFSVDREKGFREIWSHPPISAHRGNFYYHPPAVGEYGGIRFVMAGNYGGGLVCKDAATGEDIWSMAVENKAGERVGQVSSISLCDGGRAIVCYSGGEMSSAGGGLMLIDVADGGIIWQKELRCSKTTVVGDRFYAYVSSSAGETVRDHRTGLEVSPEPGYHSFWVDDCSMFWSTATDALSVGGQTYCDGKLYSIDYSPGTQGAYGGWVWCIDSDTGNVDWKARVSPFSGNAYSMCCPTVVDGKVLVGNDYGAVYVLSETPGVAREASLERKYVSEGLAHWSWGAMFALCAAVALVAVYVYRK
ncbi:MAG: PQQ-binding-like beta-propeller repeat protein [Thermoplasmatales archaeon]|nr:PQQ-binding-like beta-propeller repeat protein [Thermoplasmatales archaeon]